MLAPAAAAMRCEDECASPAPTAVDTCCAGHERPASADQPEPSHDPTDPADQDAGCCPAACQGCAARPLLADGGAPLTPNLPPAQFIPGFDAPAAGPSGVAFSVFHPPKA